MKQDVIILGSTGSIGKNIVNIIRDHLDKFNIIAITAKDNYQILANQALELKPKFTIIENQSHFSKLEELLSELNLTTCLSGQDAINEITKIKSSLVFVAITGTAAILPTINAINAGSNIAIANKESLVVAGKLITKQAKEKNIRLIPLDSEHNAIFQIFEERNLDFIESITLTASGGPFFNKKKNHKEITIKEALQHPKWQMGAKISIDSATMMNKGLEVIEAYRLFPVKKSQIKTIIHPQSIIHGIVNYQDGSSLAMLSYPDMRTPISLALNFPQRMKINVPSLDLVNIGKLEFFDIDYQQFPLLKTCYDCLEIDGLAPIALNAGNEIAVDKFLNQEITFDKISYIVNKTIDLSLAKYSQYWQNDLETILNLDKESRNIAKTLY